jgi:hypothetical protein
VSVELVAVIAVAVLLYLYGSAEQAMLSFPMVSMSSLQASKQRTMLVSVTNDGNKI